MNMDESSPPQDFALWAKAPVWQSSRTKFVQRTSFNELRPKW